MMAPAASPPKKAPPRPQRASAVVGVAIAAPAIAAAARTVRAFRMTSPHAIIKDRESTSTRPKGSELNWSLMLRASMIVAMKGSIGRSAMKHLLSSALVALAVGSPCGAGAAEVTLIAPGGIRAAVEQMIPAFERQSGHKVKAI